MGDKGNKEKELRKFFDKRAESTNWRNLHEDERALLKRLLKTMPLKEGDFVVEPGCGAGRVSREIARAVGDKGRVFAFDISGRMIAEACNNAARKNIFFARSSVRSVPLPVSVADAVFCFNCFHLFADSETLSELSRLIKPGGRLCIASSETREEINRLHSLPLYMQEMVFPGIKQTADMIENSGLVTRKLSDFTGGFMIIAERSSRGFTAYPRHYCESEQPFSISSLASS